MKAHQTKIENLKGRIELYKDWWKVVPPLNHLYNLCPRHTVTLRTSEVVHVRDIFEYDLPIIREIFGQDIYHIKQLSLPVGAIVFDVGAHIGSFSVAVHSRFPDAQITAFEPHPDNFSFLQRNAPFATCVNKAVAGAAGVAHLCEHIASSSHALGATGIEVEVVTLDFYINSVPRVDLIKIDIEGGEGDVFDHLSSDLLAKIDQIMMEVHPPHTTRQFSELLAKNGFAVTIEGDILFAMRPGLYEDRN